MKFHSLIFIILIYRNNASIQQVDDLQERRKNPVRMRELFGSMSERRLRDRDEVEIYKEDDLSGTSVTEGLYIKGLTAQPLSFNKNIDQLYEELSKNRNYTGRLVPPEISENISHIWNIYASNAAFLVERQAKEEENTERKLFLVKEDGSGEL